MKEKYKFLLEIMFGISLIVVSVIFLYKQPVEKSLGAVSVGPAFMTHSVNTYPTNAGFNYIWLGNATTTYVLATEGVLRLDLNLVTVASTTSETLAVEVAYSNNGTNWTSDDVNTTTTNVVTLNTQSKVYKWSPLNTASTTRSFNITTNLNSKFVRVGFSSWGINHTSTSSDIGLWAQASLGIEQ